MSTGLVRVIPALLALLLSGGVQGEPWRSREIAVSGGIEALVRHGRAVLVRTRMPGAGGTRYQKVHRGPKGLLLEALVDFDIASPEWREDMLADGEVRFGRAGIVEAWLAGPTRRYDHAVLGDDIEASAVVAIDDLRRRHRFALPADKVFEDRLARVVDMDGDGQNEIVVVRSDLDLGAALVVLGLVDGELRLLAETPPIGLAHRWLNPAGFGDFDGDGRREVAIVVTPHIGGSLQIYEFTRAGMRREGSAPGFSNHVMGSRELGLSAVLDADGDGIDDLALPSADRRAIRIVGFSGGNFREIARVAHESRIVTAVRTVDFDADGRLELVYGLADDRLVWTAPGAAANTKN